LELAGKRRVHYIQPQKVVTGGHIWGEGGEFVPVGIQGMVTQFEGEPRSTNSPLKTKSTQLAGGRSGTMALEIDVLIEEAARLV
jgi:hypothetical protein